MGKNNAKLYDFNTVMQAGINPKTGLPLRLGDDEEWMKQAVKKTLRVLDEQNAVNRYVWYNLPCNISSQELERMLYYKGQLAFFYLEDIDEFYFMPYALDGGIDFYGRFVQIHPIPFAEGIGESDKKNNSLISKQREFLSTLKLKVMYDIPLDDVDIKECCVLLHDYTKQMAQTIVPRQQLQDPLLNIMSDCIPFMRTALLNSTGVEGVRVQNQDEESNVEAASRSIDRAALTGRKYIPIIGALEFQQLTSGATLKSEEFMLAMQSLDNYRLSLYGLDNGGLFQKKSHMLEAEQEMNAGDIGLIMQDGLQIRQRFCDIVNAIYDLGISCEIAETALGLDRNLDGEIIDDTDQSGDFAGDQPEV